MKIYHCAVEAHMLGISFPMLFSYWDLCCVNIPFRKESYKLIQEGIDGNKNKRVAGKADKD